MLFWGQLKHGRRCSWSRPAYFGLNDPMRRGIYLCVLKGTEVAESEALKELLRECKAWHLVGSRITCDPPVENTDIDILCEVASVAKFTQAAEDQGWELAGSNVDGGEFSRSPFKSMSDGQVNLIVTEDADFASRFMVATRLAKRFNLLAKEDRVALFQGVLYGNG